MVEIKGFEKAHKNMLAARKIKEIHKKSVQRRTKELIEEGVDRDTAKVMAECGL